MSETIENQVEEVAPEPVKRGRGRPKGSVKTEHKIDENYYKNYYLEKTKPKIALMGKYTCPICNKELAQLSKNAHERDRYCKLLQKVKNLS